MKKIILVLLALVLLVSCAPTGSTIDSGLANWDNLGDGLYRKIDAQTGIACYYAFTSMESGVAFSCVSYNK